MANLLKIAAVLGVAALTACGAPSNPSSARAAGVTCGMRAAQTMSAGTADVKARRYGAAARSAENAAHMWLACGDRWRGANALIAAGELAHQSGHSAHGRALVHEGLGIMHGLRQTISINEVQSSLLAQKLNSASHDMQGHWSYW